MKNRKNALIGWLTIVIGKQLVLAKLRKPEPEPKLSKTKKGLIAGTAAGAVGVAAYLHLRPSGGGDGPGPVAD